MNIPNLMYFILIGSLVGWLVGRISKRRSIGIIGNAMIGIVGTWFGHFLFRLMGISLFSTQYPILLFIIQAIVGTYILFRIMGMLSRALRTLSSKKKEDTPRGGFASWDARHRHELEGYRRFRDKWNEENN